MVFNELTWNASLGACSEVDEPFYAAATQPHARLGRSSMARGTDSIGLVSPNSELEGRQSRSLGGLEDGDVYQPCQPCASQMQNF